MHNFDDIFWRYKDKVYSKVLLTVWNAWDAEEITQDIFVKIYFALPNFKEDSNINTWIYAIVRNTCIDYIRKKKPESIELDEVIDFLWEEDNLLSKIESADIIEHIFSFLLIEERNILILKYHEWFLITEISKMLEIWESNTKKLLWNARKKFIHYYEINYENQTA